jgi:hypothetical protein
MDLKQIVRVLALLIIAINIKQPNNYHFYVKNVKEVILSQTIYVNQTIVINIKTNIQNVKTA